MDNSAGEILGAPFWFWAVFGGVILAVLIFDLGYLSRRIRILTLSQSLLLTASCSALAILFGLGVWAYFGAEKGSLFFTAYVVEQSLSIDNVFVMSVIFSYFAVPREEQHRVLFWGIVAAMVLRAIFVALGAAIVAQFEWLLYLFGIFLIVTGARMVLGSEGHTDLSRNRALKWMVRHLRVTNDLERERFFLVRPRADTGEPAIHATRLFLAFMAINVA